MPEPPLHGATSLFLSMPILGSDRNTCAAQLKRSSAIAPAVVRDWDTDREIPLWGRIFFRVFTTLYFGLNLGAGAFSLPRARIFLAVGGFDEIYFASEEIFFTIALKRLGRFRLLREPAMTSGRKLRMYSGWKIFYPLSFFDFRRAARGDVAKKSSICGTVATEKNALVKA